MKAGVAAAEAKITVWEAKKVEGEEGAIWKAKRAGGRGRRSAGGVEGGR